MGQSLSKVSKRFIMPKISKAIESHEKIMVQDALDDIAQKKIKAGSSKYTDPSAMDGFKRDTWKDSEMTPQEYAQKQFLQKNQAEQQEMPSDLLKFLNDTGPVTKKVDKDFTSPKVYESLQTEEEQRRQEEQQQRQRRRRVMQMIGDESPKTEALSDGTTVEKTTNFSTAVKEINHTEMRFTDQEMFDLVQNLNAGTVETTRFVKGYLNNKTQPINDEQQVQHKIDLIESLKIFYAVPVLMQDTDKSIIGAWNGDNISTLKMNGIKMASENIRLLMDQSSKVTRMETRENQKSQTRLSTEEFLRQSKKSTQ